MIFGVSGPNGAGKGEVVEYLRDRSFEAFSLSDVIRAELEKRGLRESRERMIELGTELRSALGSGALADLAVEMLRSGQDYVIDSIRHPSEVERLRNSGHPFKLIWVDAALETRFRRLQGRGRVGDPESLSEMQRLEERELMSSNPAAQQLLAVRDLADFVVQNDGTFADLHLKIHQVLEQSLSFDPHRGMAI